MFQAIPLPFRTALPLAPRGGLPGGGFLGVTKGPVDIRATAEAVSIILGRLGWSQVALMDQIIVGAGGQRCYPLTVKSATDLQLVTTFAAQRAERAAYVDSALSADPGGGGGSALDPAAALRGFETGLGALWRVPWDNVHKEPLWRLSINGVRNAGGHELCPSHPCPCGFSGLPGTPDRDNSFAWRLHHFWHCPVAAAIVEEIRRILPGTTIKCEHIWLLRPPRGDLHSGAWGVVAAAAIAAMHSGRKNLIRLHLHQQQLVPPGQTLITTYFPVTIGAPPPSVMQRATRWAVAWFWCLLQDFASIHSDIPKGWGAGPPATHPFLATAAPSRRIIVRHL
jgi:hypothetical protein